MLAKLTYEKVFYFLCFFSTTAMLLADVTPLPLSISMALFVIVPFIYIKPVYLIKNLVAHKTMLALTACFFSLLPSVLYSNNMQYYAERLQIALPFLLLPFAFANAPKLNRKQLYYIVLWLIFQVFIIALLAFINYLLHPAEINQRYLESQVMPTILTHHPTFSVLIAFSIYAGYFIVSQNKLPLKIWLQNGIWVMVVCLFIFQNIYSVRLGIIALYALIFLEIGRLVFINKQFKLAIIGLIVLGSVGGITIALSPTVQNKIKNTQQDLTVIKEKSNANHHSVAMRMVSYKIALDIFKSSPLVGCGLGDMEDELQQHYAEKYPEMSKRIIPHNMFLFFLAAIGILGTLVFVLGIFWGFIFNFKTNPHLLNIHYFLVLLYAMVEAATQTQLGVAFVLLPMLIGNLVHRQIA